MVIERDVREGGRGWRWLNSGVKGDGGETKREEVGRIHNTDERLGT